MTPQSASAAAATAGSIFSAEACELARRRRIVLIDGRELATHMVDAGVGVTTLQAHKLKRIDEDYAYLYTFNREHLAAPALEQLAGMRAELERRLRAEIADWQIPPTHRVAQPLKDTAPYGLIPITRRELRTTLRRAKVLLDLAQVCLGLK